MRALIETTAPSPPRLQKHSLGALRSMLILGIILLLNSRTLNTDFNLDDFYITQGAYGGSPQSLLRSLLSDLRSDLESVFKPGQERSNGEWMHFIFLSVLEINRWLYGTNPLGYRLCNLLLHFLCALLALAIIDHFTTDRLLSLTGALIFAAHPVHSANLSWAVYGINELIPALFLFLGFYLYIRFRVTNRKKYYGLSIASFTAGLYAKEGVATLLILIMAYDVMHDYFSQVRLGNAWHLWSAIGARRQWYLPYLSIVALYIFLNLGADRFPAIVGITLAAIFLSLIEQVRLAILAAPYVLDRHHSLFDSLPVQYFHDFMTWDQGLIAIFVFLSIAMPLFYNGLKNIKHRPLLTLGALWTCICYIPVGIADTQYRFITPRRLYILSFGISCMLAALIFAYYGKRARLVLAAILIALYAGYQLKYNSDWNTAGLISRDLLATVAANRAAFQPGDALILLDVPETYNTAYVLGGYFDQALPVSLDRTPLFEGLKVKAFSVSDITQILGESGRANAELRTWSGMKKLLQASPMPSPARTGTAALVAFPETSDAHNIHVIRMNGKTRRFEPLSDLFFHFEKAVIETKAPGSVHLSPLIINDDARITLFEIPPTKITYALRPPEGAILSFGLALSPSVWSRFKGDGVTFEILVHSGPTEELLFSKYIDPKNRAADQKWHDAQVDLSKYAGQSIRLSLITRPGASSVRLYDWAGWGDIRIISPVDFTSARPR